MITPAITATRPIDHSFDENCSHQSMIAGKIFDQKAHITTSAGFHLKHNQPVFLNPNMNITGTIESESATEVFGISISTNTTALSGFTIPMKVPTETI